MKSLSATVLFILALLVSTTASAVPASQPKIVPEGASCVRISTAATDHGEDNAQKFADELLASDIEAFKKQKGLSSVIVQRRFKKCNYHLWFFGDEYNCTSLAVVCW